MSQYLKFVIYLAIISGVVGFVWQQYRDWQFDLDQQEAGLAPQGKLPLAVNPRHYTLSLRIDPDQKRFNGTVRIDVDIQQQLTICSFRNLPQELPLAHVGVCV